MRIDLKSRLVIRFILVLLTFHDKSLPVLSLHKVIPGSLIFLKFEQRILQIRVRFFDYSFRTTDGVFWRDSAMFRSNMQIEGRGAGVVLPTAAVRF